MNDHVEVLQQRVESPAVGLRLGDVGLERVVVDDHQEQEEHLHDGDDRHHVGNQLPMALPVHVDGNAAEDRQQRHPEHDRAVEAAPVGRQLVGERLGGVRIAMDVFDRVVAGDEGVDDHRRGGQHDGHRQVEGAGSAFDQALRAPACTSYRDRGRVGARDERGEQQIEPEGRHLAGRRSRPGRRRLLELRRALRRHVRGREPVSVLAELTGQARPPHRP